MSPFLGAVISGILPPIISQSCHVPEIKLDVLEVRVDHFLAETREPMPSKQLQSSWLRTPVSAPLEMRYTPSESP
jgi:hypothetical protein